MDYFEMEHGRDPETMINDYMIVAGFRAAPEPEPMDIVADVEISTEPEIVPEPIVVPTIEEAVDVETIEAEPILDESPLTDVHVEPEDENEPEIFVESDDEVPAIFEEPDEESFD